MDTKSNYIEWIDVAKGIGMILVIAGHTFCLGLSSPLYTFHLPLFFLLSGLVFNENKYQDTQLLLKTKARQIMQPWLVMALISFFVCLCIPEWRLNLSLNAMLKELYTTNTNNIQNSSLWYLVCLYMMFVLYAALRSILCKKWGGKYFFIVIAIALLFIKDPIQWLSENYLSLPDDRLPFKMDTAMIALIFFMVGLRYKNLILFLSSKRYSWMVLAILFIMVYAAGKLNGWTNLNSYDFGTIPILFYPISFFGIYVVICASVKLTNKAECKWLKSILLFYGKNSLVIFGFQSLFIRLYLYAFNHLQGLDMQLYQNYVFYHQIGAFVVVTFIASPLMVIGFTHVKALLHK